jgi:ribosomal protein L7Ae-like RNA K-turn-binding protein
MIEKYMGLCRAAGGVTTGVDSTIAEVRRGRAKFVMIACDASERSTKQLTDKCKFYNTKYFINSYDSAAIAHILGKNSPCAAACFSGKGPWEPLMRALDEAGASSCDNKCCDDRKDD